MSWTIQDLATAGLALLTADSQLTVYDGEVTGTADHYVLVYTFRQLAGALIRPDATRLTGDQRAVDMQLYCHCVGPTAASARAIAGRVEARLLNVRPVVSGRVCHPIRWLEGQPPNRDQSTGPTVMDQVDVYGWTSVPSS